MKGGDGRGKTTPVPIHIIRQSVSTILSSSLWNTHTQRRTASTGEKNKNNKMFLSRVRPEIFPTKIKTETCGFSQQIFHPQKSSVAPISASSSWAETRFKNTPVTLCSFHSDAVKVASNLRRIWATLFVKCWAKTSQCALPRQTQKCPKETCAPLTRVGKGKAGAETCAGLLLQGDTAQRQVQKALISQLRKGKKVP